MFLASISSGENLVDFHTARFWSFWRVGKGMPSHCNVYKIESKLHHSCELDLPSKVIVIFFTAFVWLVYEVIDSRTVIAE